jgi:hypothetical protein
MLMKQNPVITGDSDTSDIATFGNFAKALASV